MERPILFNTDMVKAILEGRKTQTRRIVKPLMPDNVIKTFQVDPLGYMNYQTTDKYLDGWRNIKAPFTVGDTLWVRETWGNWTNEYPESNAVYYQYKADYPEGAKTYMYDSEHECDLPKWHPSIHMPRAAARIFLKVTDVRVERLQDITQEDSYKEGFEDGPCLEAFEMFESTWNEIYGNWNDNPWVWVIEFERMV